MSDVKDRNVIDQTIIEDKKLKLIIFDPLPWDCVVRNQHASILQDKLNDYLNFIVSGQLDEHFEKSAYDRVIITIVAKYSYSKYCIEFLERVKNYIKQNGEICELEWTHMPPQENNNIEYYDGFCDDFAFNPEKIYPRLKYNFAKKPLESIEIMMNNNNFNSDENTKTNNNTPMLRFWERYIMIFMQDVGSTYRIISYDDLPAGYTIEQLEKKAFENLLRDVEYRMEETKETGVWGIFAGGNFETESLCLVHIWEEISEKFNDDLLISVPTKDIVLFVPASERKLINNMIKLARKILENNKVSSPELCFTKDVFQYDRKTKNMEVTKKYKL